MDSIKKQLKDIETELEQNAEDPELWMEKGIGLHLLGEFEQAVESFQRSLELENENAVCHYNLGNSWLELENFNQAVHHYMEAVELKPDHVPSLNNLADAYDRAGQPEKALEIFHYLVHLNPDDPLSHFNLGNFYLRNNQHIDAAECYEKTISADSSFVDAYYNIAWILNEVRATKEAESYVRDGLEIDPDHEDLKKLADELGLG